MRLFKQTLVLLTVGVAAVGCGSSESTCPDGGCADAAVAGGDTAVTGDGPMLWGLSRGMNDFSITAVANVKDDCMLGVTGLVGMSLPVSYDETTMMISIGTLQGSPPGPSLGSGKVGANMATLTRDNLSGTAGAMCTWHQKDTATLKLFDHDKFTLDVVEDEDMFMNCTSPPPPTGNKCTSTWQWTFQKK
jgi:hypothetical protein